MKTTTEQQEQLLNLTYDEHVGLNADWSIMAWLVNINKEKGLFIVDPEVTEGQYEVTERSYLDLDWQTENEFKVLFTGNAAQCIEYCNQF